MNLMDRRRFLTGAGVGALGLMLPSSVAAEARPITMWKDPNCGCCGAWGERMQTLLRRRVNVVPTVDMPAQKRRLGIPEDLWSCHSGMIDGIVTEGHVPAEDIQRLLAASSRPFAGLAVPGMPAGSPGMDVGHNMRQRYQVIGFGPAGRRAVFATHG